MSGKSRALVELGALALAAIAVPTQAQVTKNTPPPATQNASAPFGQPNVDIAYGAFQRGHYITAFNEANKLAQQSDPTAMTLLGEIYAQGLGVGRDDAKAAQWYKLAAAKGNRDAMFALAMFNFQGRAGARDLSEAARLLESAAKLGHAGAAYDLGLLYM
ncbi:MAG: tetratricopeptide repeat protein, partial [Pseudolabrys sp.]